jgi:hypothetical protein
MTRYYFDLRDNHDMVVDEEGMEIPTFEQVEEEAALSLANIAKDEIVRHIGTTPHELAIAVRDDVGPVLEVTFSFKIDRRLGH